MFFLKKAHQVVFGPLVHPERLVVRADVPQQILGTFWAANGVGVALKKILK